MPRSHISDTGHILSRLFKPIIHHSSVKHKCCFSVDTTIQRERAPLSLKLSKKNEVFKSNSVGYHTKEKSVEPKQVSSQSWILFVQKQNYRSNEEIGQPLSFLDSIKTSVPRKLTQNKRHGYRKHQQPRCTTQIIQRIPLGICKEGSPYFAIWRNINIQGGTWPVTLYSHNSSKQHNMAVDSKGTRR